MTVQRLSSSDRAAVWGTLAPRASGALLAPDHRGIDSDLTVGERHEVAGPRIVPRSDYRIKRAPERATRFARC